MAPLCRYCGGALRDGDRYFCGDAHAIAFARMCARHGRVTAAYIEAAGGLQKEQWLAQRAAARAAANRLRLIKINHQQRDLLRAALGIRRYPEAEQ